MGIAPSPSLYNNEYNKKTTHEGFAFKQIDNYTYIYVSILANTSGLIVFSTNFKFKSHKNSGTTE